MSERVSYTCMSLANFNFLDIYQYAREFFHNMLYPKLKQREMTSFESII